MIPRYILKLLFCTLIILSNLTPQKTFGEVGETKKGNILFNAAPTIDPIPNQDPIPVNSGEQNILLTGISDGGMGEKQEITVTATSNNENLISNVIVSYVSPDATGQLSYTPNKDTHGAARITVTVSDGEDEVSVSFNVVVNPGQNQKPKAPVATAPSGITLTSFTAKWNSVPDVSGYVIDVSTSSNFNSFLLGLQNKSVSGTSQVVAGLIPGTEYYYRVRAIGNNNVESNNSNTVNASTLNLLGPTALNASQVTENSFTANWQSVLGVENYQLDVSENNNFTSFVPGYQGKEVNGNSEKIEELKPNTQYFYRVRSVLLGIPSPSSNTVNVTTLATVNKAPTLDPIAAPDPIKENAGEQTVQLTGITDGGEGDQIITVTARSSNTGLIPNPNVNYTSPGTTGTLKYTPVAKKSGKSTITVTVNDGQAINNSFTRQFIAEVLAVNKKPTLGFISNVTVNTKNPATQIINLTNISPGEGEDQRLSITSHSDNHLVVPDPEVNYTYPATTGTLKFKPVKNSRGVANISVTVDDGQPENNTVVRTFSVNAVLANTPPTSQDKTIEVNKNQSYTFKISDFAYNDPDAGTGEDTFDRIRITSLPTAGTLKLNNDNVNQDQEIIVAQIPNMTFTPANNATGSPYTHIHFKVSDGIDYSVNANVFTINVLETAPATPPAPVANDATNISQTGFTANWSASTGADSYRLDVSTEENFSSTLPSFTNKTVSGTSDAVTGLTANTKYYYRVRAENTGGTSGNSNVKETTTLQVSPPTAPVANNATSVSETGFTANWSSVTGASGYKLDISTAENFGSFVSGYNDKTVSGTNEVVSGLPSNTKYFYRVRAVNAGGASNNSNTIEVQLNSINKAPTLSAISDPAPINENAGLQTINLSGISAGEGESHQTITINASSSNTALIPHPTVNYTSPNATGTLTYTPVLNRHGTAVITVTVTDNGPGTAPNVNTFTRTFTVVVNDVNHPPTLNPIPDPDPILEDSGEQTVALSGISPGENDTEEVTITASSSNTNLIPHPTVHYTNPSTTGFLSYTPVKDANGTAVITVTISDGTHPVNRTFTVRVTAVNDPPLFTIDRNEVTVQEGFTTIEKIIVTPLPVPEDEKNQVVVYSLTPATVNFANVVINPVTGEVTITSKPHQSGGQTFTITANDGQAENNIATRTFNLTVGPINKAPVFTIEPEEVVVNEDFTTTEQVVVTPGPVPDNEKNQVVTYSLAPATVEFANVSINSGTGLVTITSKPDRFGTQDFTITANDGQSVNNIATQTFKLVVNPINDPPTLDAIPSPITLSQNAGEQIIDLKGITAGPFEVQSLTVIATSGNTDLIPHPTIEYTSPATTGKLKFKPNEGKSGTAEITVTVFDNGPGNAPHKNNFSRTFTVNVNTVNLPPTIDPIPDPAPINEDADTQTIVLTGISPGPGEEGQSIVITAVSDNRGLIPDPAVNYTSPQSTGTLNYKPVANRSGSATITVTVKDNGPGTPPHNNTTERTFTVQVNEVNDPPTLDVIEDPVAIPPGSGVQTIQLTGITAGPNETQALEISAVSNNPGLIPNPTVIYTSPNTTGSLQYTPVPDLSGTAIITVTVKDDGPGDAPHINTFSRTFTVRVNNEGDLIIIAGSVNKPSLPAGEEAEVTVRIRNIGAIAVSASKLKLYLSISNEFDASSDVLLGENNIKALASGEVEEIKATVTIPPGILADNYYILAIADADQEISEFDEDNNLFAIPIAVGDEFVHLINEEIMPEYYTVGSNEDIGINTKTNYVISKVELFYRGITEEEYKKTTITGSNGQYRIPTPINDKFDEIGMEYYFEVTSEGRAPQKSKVAYTYLKYAGNGLAIPGLKSGSTVEDYQIISIPLELANGKVDATLEDDLGKYDNTQWRLFHYQNNSTIEYKEGFDHLQAGKGYWLITRHNRNVNTGEGTTPKVKKDTPFEIQLNQGWNLIGNPYNFDISWNDVLEANGNPEEVANLKVFNRVMEESDVLKKFQGGFVFSDAPYKLNIPVYKPSTLENGRITQLKEVNQNLWEVLFKVNHNGRQQYIGGFGMNANAKLGKDRYDDMTLPALGFIKNISITFNHPEYFYPNFSKDIVPIADGYTWEFTVGANLKNELIHLEWEKGLAQMEENAQLILVDLMDGKKINMKETSRYRFNLNDNRKFKVVYGNQAYIEEQLLSAQIKLGNIYPNPFTDEVAVLFEIPEKAGKVQAQLKVYDLTGKLVNALPQQEYSMGFQKVVWNGTNAGGTKCKSGMYLYTLQISGDKELVEFRGSFILNQ